MTRWTLYVDESGSFANLSEHVLVAGVLWRHSPDENLDRLKEQLRRAAPLATWPWHARDHMLAAKDGNPFAAARANDVFRALYTLGRSLNRQQTIEMLVAVESDLGDVNPPVCCRWRKLFRVLVERAALILSTKPGRHELCLSAQWIPFMQQRPRNSTDFADKAFLGSFEKLARQALRDVSLVIDTGTSHVTIDPGVSGASFAAGEESVPVGHVLADFCAFQAGKMNKLPSHQRRLFGERFFAEVGVKLESGNQGAMRSHIAASGTYYCDRAWLTSDHQVSDKANATPTAGESWLSVHSGQWRGALHVGSDGNHPVASKGEQR